MRTLTLADQSEVTLGADSAIAVNFSGNERHVELRRGVSLAQQVDQRGLGIAHDYPALLAELRILPPLDHPDPAHMLISGTGLTHLGSASARDKMHQQAGDEAALTDTMRIFKWGVEGGKPAAGHAGVQPEWFYKAASCSIGTVSQALKNSPMAPST